MVTVGLMAGLTWRLHDVHCFVLVAGDILCFYTINLVKQCTYTRYTNRNKSYFLPSCNLTVVLSLQCKVQSAEDAWRQEIQGWLMGGVRKVRCQCGVAGATLHLAPLD